MTKLNFTFFFIFLGTIIFNNSFAGVDFKCEKKLQNKIKSILKTQSLTLENWGCYLEGRKEIKKENSSFTLTKMAVPFLNPIVIGLSLSIDNMVDKARRKTSSPLKTKYCKDRKSLLKIIKKVSVLGENNLQTIFDLQKRLSLMIDLHGPWERYNKDSKQVYPCGGKTFHEFAKAIYPHEIGSLYLNTHPATCKKKVKSKSGKVRDHKNFKLFQELHNKVTTRGPGLLHFCLGKSNWNYVIKHFKKYYK
jgi:hypothetical protein